jgi:putative N6-adenine-specific DNA methylase
MLRFIATCPEEIKPIVAEELASLGASDITCEYKAVHFQSTLETSYTIHLKIRSASRILRVVREGAAKTNDIIKAQSSKVDWSRYIPADSSFKIESSTADRGQDALNANLIGRLVREGLLASYERKGLPAPKVDLKNPKVTIVAFVAGGKITLSLDSSGKSLHKRGYKHDDHPAPIKETLAAAILKMVQYEGTLPLLDPMCGSGTFPIEAASIALNKAPLIHRKKGEFGFEYFKDFDKLAWRRIQDEARQQKSEQLCAPIYAADISPEFVAMARENALRARVEKYISFETKSFLDQTKPADKGLIVANLPYGERIEGSDLEKLTNLYKEIGNTLKRNFSGWRAALLVAENSPHKLIGLKPSRKIPILNGMIPCKLLIFDLYEGAKVKSGSRTTE